MSDGLDVVTTPLLPSWPSPGEDAVRTVRHGLAHVLAWWDEKPGPRPGEPTHALLAGDGTRSGRPILYCSEEYAAVIRASGADAS